MSQASRGIVYISPERSKKKNNPKIGRHNWLLHYFLLLCMMYI